MSMPAEERSVKALTLADGTDKAQDGVGSGTLGTVAVISPHYELEK